MKKHLTFNSKSKMLVVWFVVSMSISISGCEKKSSNPTNEKAPKLEALQVNSQDPQVLLDEFVKPNADLKSLSQQLEPTLEDYKAVFVEDFAIAAHQKMTPIWKAGQMGVGPKEGQTIVMVGNGVSTTDLKAGKPEALQSLPGGMKDVANKFKDGFIVYQFKFVKPGEKYGYSFTGLIYVNGHWKLFPQPWRILR